MYFKKISGIQIFIIMKKNILVYDSSHAYLAFIKKQFSEEFTVKNYVKLDHNEVENLDRYDAIFFMINNETELIDLMYIYTKVNNLFISSNYRKINDRLDEFNNITILNLNNSKKQIAEQIRFHLNLLETNQQNIILVKA